MKVKQGTIFPVSESLTFLLLNEQIPIENEYSDCYVPRVFCVYCFVSRNSCLSVFLFAPLLGRCLLADSTANHHSDVMMFCQSADVPAVFEDSS